MRRRVVKRRRGSRRKRLLALCAALAAIVAWWLWPRPPPPLPQPAASPRVTTAAVAPVVLHRPPPVSAPAVSRAALLAAVRDRAPALQRCGGSLLQLPLRLHLQRSGVMRAVEITGPQPPAQIGKCVHDTAMTWSFRELRLQHDLELLVTVELAPGA